MAYVIACFGCGVEMERQGRKPKGALRVSCPQDECRTKTTEAHNAEVAAYHAELARRRQARAAERRASGAPARRQPTPLYGDYAQLAALHGIRTDGTGRRN